MYLKLQYNCFLIFFLFALTLWTQSGHKVEKRVTYWVILQGACEIILMSRRIENYADRISNFKCWTISWDKSQYSYTSFRKKRTRREIPHRLICAFLKYFLSSINRIYYKQTDLKEAMLTHWNQAGSHDSKNTEETAPTEHGHSIRITWPCGLPSVWILEHIHD